MSKINVDKALAADLTKHEGHSHLRASLKLDAKMDININADVIIQKMRRSRSKARRDTRAANQT